MRAVPGSWQAGPQWDGCARHLPVAGHRQVSCTLVLAGGWMDQKMRTSTGDPRELTKVEGDGAGKT